MFSKSTSVDKAIAPLLKVVSNLEQVVEAALSRHEANNVAISTMVGENAVLMVARKRAGRIIEALEAITEPYPTPEPKPKPKSKE